MRLLASDECPGTAEQLRQAVLASPGSPVDPEALWALGAELGYVTEVGWSWTDVGTLRAVFRRTAHNYAQDELPARPAVRARGAAPGEDQRGPHEGADDGDEAPPQGQRLEPSHDAVDRTGPLGRCVDLGHQP